MDLHILFFQQRYFFSSVLPVFLLTYSYFWKQKEQIRMKGIASVFALCTILLSSCARSLESTTDVVRPGDRSRTSAYRCLTDGQLRPTAFAAVPPCSYSSTRTAPPAGRSCPGWKSCISPFRCVCWPSVVKSPTAQSATFGRPIISASPMPLRQDDKFTGNLPFAIFRASI